MAEEKSVLFELVDLPSKGLLYPSTSPLSSGQIKIKYPTAKEEDILTNINYIKQGTVFDKLIESVLVDKINIKDILVGDKNAILIAIRVLAYGSEYKIKIKDIPITIDLTKVSEKELNSDLIKTSGINEFYFQLPHSKVEIGFKLLTAGDEDLIEKELEGIKKIRPSESPTVSTRLKFTITNVSGKRDTKTIREFVDEILSRDSKALRTYINEITPNVELTYEYDFGNGLEKGEVPILPEFFWPE